MLPLQSCILMALLWVLPLRLEITGDDKDWEGIPYPEGYRRWTHVKTGFTGPRSASFKIFGGFHHIYANDKAIDGYQSDRFPEGSVIVFDRLAMIEKDDGMIVEGERRLVDVMFKDSTRFRSTGGWGFEEFKGNSRSDRAVGEQAQKKCFNCHESQATSDFVFSKLRK